MPMIEITTSSSMRVKPRWPGHRDRYADMAHLPERGAFLVHRHSDHTIGGGNEPVSGSLHHAIDSSYAGILKIELARGDSQLSAGGAADAAVREWDALRQHRISS
jgi:hypothetical protein